MTDTPRTEVQRPLRVLLVEDNPEDTLLVKALLKEVTGRRAELMATGSLKEASTALQQSTFDAVLLDLSLPDSAGLSTVTRMLELAPDLPVIVHSALSDRETALASVQEGAQDYVVKGQFTGESLLRSIDYAIERQRLLSELRSLSLSDELTGVHNVRGFLSLAQHQLASAKRMKTPLVLLFLDVDGLKRINDQHGHPAGDKVLAELGLALQRVFRDSDVIGRLGGDEFAVLAVARSAVQERALIERLQQALRSRNEELEAGYRIACSIGLARFDPERPCSIAELIRRADAAMYREKHSRQQAFEG